MITRTTARTTYVEETPQWMIDLAAKIATDYIGDHEYGKRFGLQRAIVGAMTQAGREVALYFAANPDKLKEVPRA